jgi:hypothetical protein
MTLLAELTDFLHSHRSHGPINVDATDPAWNGYLLALACSCGVVGHAGPGRRQPSSPRAAELAEKRLCWQSVAS